MTQHQYLFGRFGQGKVTDCRRQLYYPCRELNDEFSVQRVVMSRRKRKERTKIEIYVNYKIIEQVNSIKYLGIIFDNKMTFREHVNYIEEKCKKLIFMLAKSAKLTWGLKHEALRTIYTGGILPLILYGAPVWSSVLNKKCYRGKIIRTQRLINIKIAKAYRTVSNEALCVNGTNSY